MGIFKDPKTGLIVMMWLTFGFFFVEIIVGYMTNSMALVADSFHMLGDVAALVISFLSVKVRFGSLSRQCGYYLMSVRASCPDVAEEMVKEHVWMGARRSPGRPGQCRLLGGPLLQHHN